MKPIEQQTDAELIASLREAAALPDAPVALQRAAVDLWPSATPGWSELVGRTMRHLRAVLSFDSAASGPLALGLRGAAAHLRHMVFSAEGHDIDLRIEAAATGFVVSGQVLGPEEHGHVELQRETANDDASPLTMPIDALGEFRFEPVAPGTYRLRLRMSGVTVELPALDVGPRGG